MRWFERWRLSRLQTFLGKATEAASTGDFPTEHDVRRAMTFATRAFVLLMRLNRNGKHPELHSALHAPLYELFTEFSKITLDLPQLTKSGKLIHPGDPGYVDQRPILSNPDWRRTQTAKIRALNSFVAQVESVRERG
jgi:hypothetical protein